MIYKGTRIYRFTDGEIEKGDIEFIPLAERPEIEVPVRFMYSDVIEWEVYSNPQHPFKQKKQVLCVDLKQASSLILIIENLDRFDKLMEDFKQGFNISFKNQ